MNAKGKERRKAERYSFSTAARFLLRGEREGVGTLLDVSESGLALLTDVDAEEGDDLVIYPDGLGRLTGKVVRTFQGGLGVAFSHSDAQREIVRKKILQALKGTPYMRLGDQRLGIRVKYNIDTTVSIDGSDSLIPGTIVDMSPSGCLLKCDARPPIGVSVRVGMLQGRVSRYDSDGFAIEFEGHGAPAADEPQESAEAAQKAG